MDACSRQADCLIVFGAKEEAGSTCDVNGKRTVCIYWAGSEMCGKDASDTVSHSCPVVNGYGDDANTKTEGWSAGEGHAICVQVTAGEIASFGVKDGSVCSAPGTYTTIGGLEGVCEGPQNVCEGHNTKECGWHFQTDICP